MDDLDLSADEPLVGGCSEPSQSEPAAGSTRRLTPREKEMLLLERQWFQHAGMKDNRIREKWDISVTRYYQLLNRLIDDEAALAWDPITVGRLRRQREAKQRTRGARGLTD